MKTDLFHIDYAKKTLLVDLFELELLMKSLFNKKTLSYFSSLENVTQEEVETHAKEELSEFIETYVEIQAAELLNVHCDIHYDSCLLHIEDFILNINDVRDKQNFDFFNYIVETINEIILK